MKKYINIFVMLIVVFSLFSFKLTAAEAGEKRIAHVNVKSGTTLNVRSGPGTKYKKVGTLKKDAGVYVYAKTKSGWSEIRYKKKKAYVATKYLTFANSYLMDKNKAYTYMSNGKKYRHVYSKSKYGWDYWIANKKEVYVVREDTKGLYTGYPDSEYWTDIKYPVRVGKTFGSEYEGFRARITSVSKTVKVPAGTFKNCVEIKYKYDNGDTYTSYYAKNAGFIKGVHNGKTNSLLVKLEKNN